MKRILINATHNEEIRVALCKGNHMYDFDLENRTREQKKANIYKAHVTRVEPSLEAVFVEYGAKRQGFLPVREIAKEYLSGNPRNENIRDLIKEGDTLIVQVEKEERGNKGAALSSYISLAGRYLVLMPNNPRGGGISRQISGKMREDMKRIVANLEMPKGMSVIIRTAGIGKTQEDLQHDLNHLLHIWKAIGEQNRNYPSPRLVHQEAGVVTRAVRDYLRDDISEIWVDNEDAYNEAAYFIESVMPKQLDKLRKYTDFEPMFARFGIEKQIETAYQREVRLPSGGSIVIDQTEAMVAIDINSARSTKGSDVAETAYHTNLEAAEEIARQLRLRDMGGLVVIDFIDMYDNQHQKDVEKRLIESTKYDRARVQFGEISKFGLMEMSRQRLRPSLEESTGYKCPRCHGNGMIRDLRSLGLSIMRQIEQAALTHQSGELQAEVPNDIAAFLLNEKRDSLVYLEQDSGTRITILPHAHMESPEYEIHYNPEGFAPSSYERITTSEEQQTNNRGYEVNWQTAETERPKQQPKRKPRSEKNTNDSIAKNKNSYQESVSDNTRAQSRVEAQRQSQQQMQVTDNIAIENKQPQAVAWLSNLFAPTPQAQTAETISSQEAAQAIETIVNNGGQSLGSFGQVDMSAFGTQTTEMLSTDLQVVDSEETEIDQEKSRRQTRKSRNEKGRNKKERRNTKYKTERTNNRVDQSETNEEQKIDKPKREPNSRRESRGEFPRGESLTLSDMQSNQKHSEIKAEKLEKPENSDSRSQKQTSKQRRRNNEKSKNDIKLHVAEPVIDEKEKDVVHISLDENKKQPKQTKPNSKDSQRRQSNKTDNVEKKKVATIEAVKLAKNINPQPKVAIEPETSKVKDKTKPESETKITDKAKANLEKAVSTVQMPQREDGRATNDPRVVREELSKSLSEKSSVTDANIKKSVITGTVGEFLRATLENAEERLNKEGIIACFIEAVSVARKENQVSDTSITGHKNEEDFDFSNYGYAPLTPEYLAQFSLLTQSVGQFDIAQGKTPVDAMPIGRRALNDPRGQHPDYQEVEVNKIEPAEDHEEIQEVSITEVISTEINAVEENSTSENAESKSDALEAIDVAKTLAETQEIDVIDTKKILDPTKSVDNTPPVADEFTEAFSRMLNDDISNSEIIESKIEVEEADEFVKPKRVTKSKVAKAIEKIEEHDGKERSKTTFDKYKSMLANVSEQLSTQSGTNSLFLSTPKVPKTRTRKKKDSE